MPTSATTFSPMPTVPGGAPAAARAVFALLARLQVGRLDVQLPDGALAHFGAPGAGHDGPHATLRLRNWNVCAAALRSGDIGVAETYIAGDWTTTDLAALLGLFIANRAALEEVVYGHWWGNLLHRLRHWTHRNSRAGSRRNIHAHYDLGNAFYRLWLDGSMNYSSAWFNGDRQQPMAQAQQAKMRRAIGECGLQDGQRLLEIGCGWGALAECAVREFGARVTGVTLSTEQLAFGRQRLADGGLLTQAELRLQDYRDIDDEPFDAIVSIEMFEAVGRAYWASWFDTVRRKLKPGGRACVQTITIRDELFERYVGGTDFIQQYIFPGGLLPSPAVFREQARLAGLTVVKELAFGADYAETLRRWRADFLRQEDAVRAQGFDTRFLRTWEFYLAYCEAAFSAGSTDVMQFTLAHA
ncbi:class I SAM-dependent methyltransferase [Aquabacterium sp. OR-4]|uniref:class I SAM-dependent methyltransferase n=1 Tax=Aquabacterium sp. OR-4 TaxID=2978127 RepID=UPI0021B3628F|nr:cyclopropane-fatty-acyl-phospholipid synthase family protein [Aquabacterium sp. OR-4]MDT7834045.1 cyclopropane-fatty-acyl-phospholipid synthase family protein [Aquabacterium sp. OR-4]